MTSETKKKGLRYIGPKWVLGIPARDLSPREVMKYGRERILRTGFYEEYIVDKPRRARPGKEKPAREEVDYGRTKKAEKDLPGRRDSRGN